MALCSNRSTEIDALRGKRQSCVAAVLIVAWIVQFADLFLGKPYENSKNVEASHLLLIATTWGTLTAVYTRLRFTRSICFHSFGLLYFLVFFGCVTFMAGCLPGNLSADAKWAVYSGCFVGTFISAPYTVLFMSASFVKRSRRVAVGETPLGQNTPPSRI